MDWELKMPPWDLVELDRDAEPNIGSVVVGSSGGGVLGRQASGLDLKLGGLGDFGSSIKWKDQPSVSKTMVPSSAPVKRSRAPSSSIQNASCLVEGCKADLSKCREYHRRHKVCEIHSKTPVVIVGGQEQRFCQQCSRFHLLVEFDEVKRSCRKRLDGHNRRRRKPQPDSTNSATLFSNHQGTRFHSYPQILQTATSEPNWTGIIKAEDNNLNTHCRDTNLVNRDQYFSNSSHNYNKERKRFPFLRESETTLISKTSFPAMVHQPHIRTIIPYGGSSSRSNSKVFSNGLTQDLHSDCALSLLSSPTQTSGINISRIVPPADRITMGQPFVSSLPYGNFTPYSCSHESKSVSPTGLSFSGLDSEPVGTVLVSDANDACVHYQSIYQLGGEGSSDGTSQTLPFSWQ